MTVLQPHSPPRKSILNGSLLTAIVLPILVSGCDALNASTEPQAPLASSTLPPASAPSFAAPTQSTGASGFGVQPIVQQNQGFPAGTIDPNGTVGRYQVGPSYNLNGQVITPREDLTYIEQGIAGWYGDGFEGATTANGEILKRDIRTFAHRTLPFGTIARITNLGTGRSVVARVNDRGPIQTDRLIDVSTRIAQDLAFNQAGRAQVQVQVLEAETRRVAELTGGTIGGGSSFASGGGASQVTTTSLTPLTPLSPLAPPTPISSTASRVSGQPAVSGAPSPSAGGVVYVQAGSFREQANAIRLQGVLQAIGPVLVEPVTVNGRQFWRVRVGPYGSESEARIVLGRVVAAGATDAIIRRVN